MAHHVEDIVETILGQEYSSEKDALVETLENLIPVTCDESEFHVVDGEEGDNGIVKVSEKKTGRLLSIYHVEGGDCNWYEHTQYFIDTVAPFCKEYLEKKILDIRKKAIVSKKTHLVRRENGFYITLCGERVIKLRGNDTWMWEDELEYRETKTGKIVLKTKLGDEYCELCAKEVPR